MRIKTPQIGRNKYMKPFRILRIFFARRRQRASLRGLLEVRLQLPVSQLSEREISHLHDYIGLWLLAGFQVRVTPTLERISPECVGMQSFLFEGILIHRKELRLPQEVDATTLHVSLLIDLFIRPACE